MLTGSKGLVADGVHSAADAFASLFILVALKIAEKPHTERHPFGYGKVEYISTLVAGVFLFGCASLILVDVLKSFQQGIHEVPHNAAIMATLLSLIFSLILFTANKCAGTQLGSPAMIANAYESKADCLSSGAVLIGLLGTKMGFIYADAVAAAVVSLFIYRMGVEMVLQGIHGLIDISADNEVINKIVQTSLQIAGVESVRSVNTRCMGQKIWIDLTINVSEKKTILEAHMIAEKVKETVLAKIEGIGGMSISSVPVRKVFGF